MDTRVTKRSKKCIICGVEASTGEHVFPSALGGRRENKGIYCEEHNNRMGAYVEVLQQQLGFINATLEVEPDRGSAKPFVFEGHDGQRYAVAGADIRPAPNLDQILDSHVIGKSQRIELDPALLPKLKARAEKRGLKLEISEKTPPRTEYRLEPHSLRLTLGGEDGMRAVAYLALTFVAHHWPDVARLPGLSPIKQMLCSGSTYKGLDRLTHTVPVGEFVFWTPIMRTPTEVVHPTGLGHTVMICINAGQVLAYVSLLDLLCFVIHVGEAGAEYDDRTVVTHVDPFEKHFGKDWTTYVFDHALINSVKDADYLRKAVLESGHMQAQLHEIMRRVFARRDRIEAERVAEKFQTANSLPEPDRQAAIRSIVEGCSQRLVNLIVMFAREGNDANFVGALVKTAAKRAIEGGPSSVHGLTVFGRRVLSRVVARIADQLAGADPGLIFDEHLYLGLFNGEFAQATIALALVDEHVAQE